MTSENIKDMGILEYQIAIDYAWNAYVQRRVDYWIAEAFGEKKSGKGTSNVDWTNLNPVAKQLQKDRRQGRIPQTFLESMKK